MADSTDPGVRCAVVSGGGSGIGLATCRHLPALGFVVASVGVDREDSLPPDLAIGTLDVTDRARSATTDAGRMNAVEAE